MAMFKSANQLTTLLGQLCLSRGGLVTGISRHAATGKNLAPAWNVCRIHRREVHMSYPIYGRSTLCRWIWPTTTDEMRDRLKPVPLRKSGGRDHTGKVINHRRGGGAKQNLRLVDHTRVGPEDGGMLHERVMEVLYDPCRSADIAVVATGEKLRYITATENMKEGDIIKTSAVIPRMAVRAQEGDAHPAGALPVGTLVHNVELFPGEGGKFVRAAGTTAQILRKVGDRVILKIPSKREINIAQECMVTVGRVSNIDHNKQHIGSPNRMRWLGIRPRSGLWHRKTGYNGRKIRPIPPMRTFTKPPPPIPAVYRDTH